MLELKPNSRELAAEIDDKQSRMNGTEAKIVFKNGSYIKVVTASDSSRGNRATLLLLDEFRMVAKDVVDAVLRKFLTQRRMPRYAELSKDERTAEYSKEKNMTMYLSSAYWADSWAYLKCKDTFQFMLDDSRRQFVCGLPYELSIAEGLLDPDTVADEMAETDFSEIKFSMEYESKFYGITGDSFFEFNAIAKNRHIKYPMLPNDLVAKLGNSSLIKIQQKQPGEIRIISADVALMSSRKNDNDATAIFINRLMPSKAGRYVSNIVYADAMEGKHAGDQALKLRKLYDEYQCDYIVLDCAGVGMSLFEYLVRDIVDPDTGEIYPAISCCNDQVMAERCTVPGAAKVIWSIKTGAAMNSDCALLLREGFRSGRVRLLVTEYDAEELLNEIKGYKSLDASEKMTLQMPYIHTTLLINELVNLQHDESNGRIKIYERAGMRKDRYSSLAYNYYVANQLESKLERRRNVTSTMNDVFMFRAPKIK